MFIAGGHSESTTEVSDFPTSLQSDFYSEIFSVFLVC